MLKRIRNEPAMFASMVQAGLVLLVAFHAPISKEQMAAIMAFVSVAVGFWIRSRVAPHHKPKGPPSAPIVGAMALLLVSCTSVRDTAVVTVNASAVFGEQAEHVIAALDVAEQQAALRSSDPAAEIAKVRARYHPAWVAYRDFRTAHLAARATLQAYDAAIAAGQDPNLANVEIAMHELSRASVALTAAVNQIRGGK